MRWKKRMKWAHKISIDCENQEWNDWCLKNLLIIDYWINKVIKSENFYKKVVKLELMDELSYVIKNKGSGIKCI